MKHTKHKKQHPGFSNLPLYHTCEASYARAYTHHLPVAPLVELQRRQAEAPAAETRHPNE
jgi:hypothetical protein